MADFDTITGTLTGRSFTRGWDAVVAIATAPLNDFLFDQYAAQGPGSPVLDLELIVANPSDPDYLVYDVTLGPPLLAFNAEGAGEVGLTMELVSGSGYAINAGSGVQSIVFFEGTVSSVAAQFPLSAGSGDIVKSQVQIDLSQGSWTASVAGVAADSTTNANLAAALKGHYAGTPFVYALGGIADSGQIPALTPSGFQFAVQDSCLLMLVRTNGAGGESGSLDTAIVPDGATAALLLANDVMFGQVLPGSVQAALNGVNVNGVGFESIAASTAFVNQENTVRITAGDFNDGQVSSTPDDDGNFVYSCKWDIGSYVADNLIIPMSGLNFAPGGKGIDLTASVTFTNQWCSYLAGQNQWQLPETKSENVEMTMAAKGTIGISVDASQQEDQFAFTVSAKDLSITFTVDTQFDFWQKYFEGHLNLDTTVTSSLGTNLATALSKLSISPVNAFCISSLLFPSGQLLQFADVAMPSDLYAAGTVTPRVVVTPGQTTLPPGGSVALSAASSSPSRTLSDVSWSRTPGVGAMAADGTYTAPVTVSKPQIVIAQATASDGSTTPVTGSAIIRLAPGSGDALSIQPASLLVPAGGTVAFDVFDADGNEIGDATVTASDGSASSGFGYSYTAPASLDVPQAVTITATDPKSQAVGTATWVVSPVDRSVAVTPAKTTLVSGEAMQVSVTGVDATSFAWSAVAHPPGADAGTFSARTGGTVTYTAPAVSGQLIEVRLFAIGDNPPVPADPLGRDLAVGMAQVVITISPS